MSRRPCPDPPYSYIHTHPIYINASYIYFPYIYCAYCVFIHYYSLSGTVGHRVSISMNINKLQTDPVFVLIIFGPDFSRDDHTFSMCITEIS